MNLLEETIQLLKEADLTKTAIVTGFSYQWLWLVREGKIKSPSVQKIEELHQYLSHELPSADNS